MPWQWATPPEQRYALREPQVGNFAWEIGFADPDGYRIHFSRSCTIGTCAALLFSIGWDGRFIDFGLQVIADDSR